MKVYRIAKKQYIQDLSGTGARIYGGRWNSKGNPVLYTAESRALAALETIVHVPQKNMTADFQILSIEIPEDIKIKKIAEKDLPKSWKKIPIQKTCQEIGDYWLRKGKFAILKIPSVVIPEEYNFLINPMHDDFRKISAHKPIPFIFDIRMSEI